MEKIENKKCKLVEIGKTHCVFEVGDNNLIALASPRVANDILHGCDVYIEKNVIVKGNLIGHWLATPSRFN